MDFCCNNMNTENERLWKVNVNQGRDVIEVRVFPGTVGAERDRAFLFPSSLPQ